MAEAPRIATDAETFTAAFDAAGRLISNIERVVLGKHEEITLILAALISGGHVLLEDVPGTAKTILARAIAQTIEGSTFARLQCTPDLQPTDVTGLSIFNQKTREFEFRPGPVFTNILLVDELDRFALQSALGYPAEEEEIEVVLAQRHGHPIASLQPQIDGDDVDVLGHAVEEVYVDELVLRWIVDLVRATRTIEGVAVGASVRGSLTLERAARAWALLHGRDHVVPDDVETLFLPVLGHRVLLTASFLAETRALGRDAALELVKERCLAAAPPPAPDWDPRGR